MPHQGATAVPNAKIAMSLEGVQGLASALGAKGQRKVLPHQGLRVGSVTPKPQVDHCSSLDRSKLGHVSDRRTTTMWGSLGHLVSISFPARVIRRK